MIDRRSEFRLFASGPAKIVAADRDTAIDCTINDISGSGGSFEISASVRLPETFELVPDDDDSSGYRCRMIWRKDNRVGFKFDQQH